MRIILFGILFLLGLIILLAYIGKARRRRVINDNVAMLLRGSVGTRIDIQHASDALEQEYRAKIREYSHSHRVRIYRDEDRPNSLILIKDFPPTGKHTHIGKSLLKR
jgi:hypothetical protein